MCCSTVRTAPVEPAASPIRALHSLTAAQVSAVRSALRRLPMPWSLDEQEGYDGELTLILAPEDGHSDLSFALWRSPAGFHLCSLRGDEQIGCEIFTSLRDALREIPAAPGQAWHPA
jgi:hypothetical protein